MKHHKRLRPALFAVFLAYFAVIALSAQFFHQEKTFKPIDNCPICIWKMNSVLVAALYFLVLSVIFNVIRLLIERGQKARFYTKFYSFLNRGPPLSHAN